jgi:hypothetical protein
MLTNVVEKSRPGLIPLVAVCEVKRRIGMTKRTLAIVFAFVVAAIPAMAGAVTVNFTGAGGVGCLAPTDIVAAPCKLNGVTFQYNVGLVSTETASIGSGGISGINTAYILPPDLLSPLSGNLTLDFGSLTVLGLSFNYTVFNQNPAGGQPTPGTTYVSALIGLSAAPSDSTGAFVYGPVDLSQSFNQATLYFGDGTNGNAFSVTSMSYVVPDAGVPEPGTIILMAFGLLGLGGGRLLKRRS